MVKIFPSSQLMLDVFPFEQSVGVPVQGIQIEPSLSKTVCSSLIVHEFPSSQLMMEVVPFEQSTGVPKQGIQIEPSQSKVVC